MDLMAAVTITQEDLQKMVLKMLKANKKEALEDLEKATTKYMKEAIKLKQKAHAFLEDNKKEFIDLMGFNLDNGLNNIDSNYLK